MNLGEAPFQLLFNMDSGLCPERESSKRYLSDVKNIFYDTAEVYYCLSGQGMLMMENQEGEWQCLELHPGMAVYVIKGYAHRSINTGTQPLVNFFSFRADAGHDHKTIAEHGFRHLVVQKDDQPQIIKNPRWNAP